MAGDVLRYNTWTDIRGEVHTDDCTNGDWVKYEDHAARLTALEQENKRLREALEMARSELWETGSPEDEHHALWHIRAALTHEDKP